MAIRFGSVIFKLDLIDWSAKLSIAASILLGSHLAQAASLRQKLITESKQPVMLQCDVESYGSFYLPLTSINKGPAKKDSTLVGERPGFKALLTQDALGLTAKIQIGAPLLIASTPYTNGFATDFKVSMDKDAKHALSAKFLDTPNNQGYDCSVVFEGDN